MDNNGLLTEDQIESLCTCGIKYDHCTIDCKDCLAFKKYKEQVLLWLEFKNLH